MSHEYDTTHGRKRGCDCGRTIGYVKDLSPNCHLCLTCAEKEELAKDMAFLRQLREQHEGQAAEEDEREKFLDKAYNDARQHE